MICKDPQKAVSSKLESRFVGFWVGYPASNPLPSSIPESWGLRQPCSLHFNGPLLVTLMQDLD